MRKFLVEWYNGTDTKTEEVELPLEMKANASNFAKIINDSLNHYNNYHCHNWDIYSWSLIEK